MLSVLVMPIEFVISARSNSASLVRMALFRVRKATENDTNVGVKSLSETLMGLHWILSGMRGCYLETTGGDGRARGAGWK